MSFRGAQTSKTSKGQGKNEIIPILACCSAFLTSHGLSVQIALATKQKEAEMEETHVKFALDLGKVWPPAEIYNVQRV
ncbi:hypothetical protein JG688_00017859 [Phytophthora aleatoria]|uniref:Uncharacterized protein n=1 Tax=Phytophthora aleatoria TaxID=2496075 RepID=A0A8J5I0A5_9STRA|nr:hypothetical protein JG688_00017859 [Phytophthora aleatoria]